MYSLDIKPELDKKLAKLYTKNRKQYEIIMKKALEENMKKSRYYNGRFSEVFFFVPEIIRTEWFKNCLRIIEVR